MPLGPKDLDLKIDYTFEYEQTCKIIDELLLTASKGDGLRFEPCTSGPIDKNNKRLWSTIKFKNIHFKHKFTSELMSHLEKTYCNAGWKYFSIRESNIPERLYDVQFYISNEFLDKNRLIF